MKSRKIIYTGTCILTFVIMVVATIGNSWNTMKHIATVNVNGQQRIISIDEGLWKVCVYSDYQGTVRGCTTIESSITDKHINEDHEVPGWLQACRAFTVLSCLAGLVGVIMILVSFKREIDQTRFIVSFSFVAATVLMLIGIVVYTIHFESATEFASQDVLIPNDTDYGWAYISAWIGVILSGIHAFIIFFVQKKNAYRY
ncbi:lens fiber membrane intrinsic protein-like [Clytia hemisphaerica]|uniref:Uncharacterized protein n=1 Tax=Clytia hemisphaerica TaxID=252671 RepID=A0A7M5VDK7_9CNID